MKTENYINQMLKTYNLVSVLSRKNDCMVLRLRNRKLNREIILRSYPKPVAAYQQIVDLECENLPIIYDVINLEDGQIVLEEYIEGVTVCEVMQSGKYTFLGARRIIKAVCNALNLLHERGIIHRDIKPENIIIGKNGRVVLIDLNASRKISNASHDTVIMGTVGYASPEQLGVAQTDARTDIYALGVLLNIMLTGKHPSEIIAKGRAGKIVRKCTNVNPADRFQSVKALYKKI